MLPAAFVASPVLLRTARNEPLSGRRLRSDSTLARLHHGVYAAKDDMHRLAPWDRYSARVHAVAVAWPDAVFFRESAAALHGLPVIGEPRDIHVFDPGAPSTRRYGGVVVHSSRDARETRVSGGIAATTVPHTVLDVARVAPAAVGLATADAALRRMWDWGGGIADVQAIADRETNRRGIRKLAGIWPRATREAESVGESISRAVIEWLGFEAPVLQYWFEYEGFRDRVDFFWPGQADRRGIGRIRQVRRIHGRGREVRAGQGEGP